jgi:hypothetical protein
MLLPHIRDAPARIASGISVILTDLRGFPQSVQANAGIVL